jgi:hypothetical protein
MSAESTTWRERSAVLGVLAGTWVALAEIAPEPISVTLMVVCGITVVTVVARELRKWWVARPSQVADDILVSLLHASLAFVALAVALS